jgi:hypothetical protein
MNEVQKQSVKDMRARGASYSQIAEHLGISANTVKSFCRRSEVSQSVCKNCGKAISGAGSHKPKTFCNDSCRGKWWRSHSDLTQKRAVSHFICTYCHKPFNSYGSRSRKFCSRKCYISHRYGVP